MDSNANAYLPRQLIANSVIKQELRILNTRSHLADQQTNRSAQLGRFKLQPTCHCRLFGVLSLIFDAVGVGVWRCLLFTILCWAGIQNNLLFLNIKPK